MGRDKVRINKHTLLYVSQPLTYCRVQGAIYSTLQKPGMEKNLKMCIDIYVYLHCFAVYLHHCQSTMKCEEKVAQSCPTLCDPTDCRPPGSSVHGILQASILEWVAIPFSRDLPDLGVEPEPPALPAGSLPSEPQGKPFLFVKCNIIERLRGH